MKNPTNSELKQQLKALKSNIGNSWISDDHINDKIKDIEAELERRKINNKQ